MIKAKKITTVADLIEKLKKAKSVILTDYSGLNVAKISDLRKEIKEAGGSFEVVKNSLFKLAAKEEKLPLGKTEIEGPTATLWLNSDDLTPLKKLHEFIKKSQIGKIKFGFWENELISADKIDQLATLPTIEQLRGMMVGTVSRPLYGLVNALAWNLRSLVQVLSAEAEKRSPTH